MNVAQLNMLAQGQKHIRLGLRSLDQRVKPTRYYLQELAILENSVRKCREQIEREELQTKLDL